MSYYNDYAVKMIADQRQHDFQAEAANERLARIARAHRVGWWRRLLARPETPAAAGAPAPRPTLQQHPIAR